jgi:hypothetical protein
MPRTITKISQMLHLKYSRSRHGVSVPAAPDFDAKGLEYFTERVGRCRMYLEYGAGGSTVIAARKAGSLLTVDNDRAFLEGVRRKIEREIPGARAEYIHVDTGLTSRWGTPVFTTRTRSRVSAWRQYPAAPWERLKTQPARGPLPDLILIDGRFRVACALLCLRRLSGNAEFEILVDDYDGRPFYGEIAKHAELLFLRGRMAVFGPKRIDERALDLAFRQYAVDWR